MVLVACDSTHGASSQISIASESSVLLGHIETDSSIAYDGPDSLRMSYHGGGVNGYARLQNGVDIRVGESISYSAAVFLPNGFKSLQQQQVAIMRWDNWKLGPAIADQGGIVVNADGYLVMVVESMSDGDLYAELTEPLAVPENQWVLIEGRQVISPRNGEALNQVWINGEKKAESTLANIITDRSVTKMRFGIVAIGAGKQLNDISLNLDLIECECGD